MASLADLFTGDPMTDPMQVRPAVLPSTPAAPPQPLDFFSTMFGGQPGLNEQFGPDAVAAASRAAKLRAGLALLAAGDRRVGGRGLGEALQQGLAAGQEGFQQALSQTAAIQQQARRRQLFAALQAQPGDTNDTVAARLEKLLPQALATDPETAKLMVAYLGHLKSMKGEWQVANLGTAGAYFVNPETRQVEQIAPGQPRSFAPEKTLNVMGPDGKPWTVYTDREGNELFRLPQVEKAGQNGGLTPGQENSAADRVIARYDRFIHNEAIGKAAAAWNNAKDVAERAAQGRALPGDITTAIDAISRLQNPGAVVRVGTMQIQLDKIGSWPERFKRMIAQAQTGNWPPELIQGMTEAMRGIAKGHFSEQEKMRNAALSRAKRQGLDVTEEDLPRVFDATDFNVQAPTPAAPTNIAPRLPGESPAAYLKRTSGQ